MAYLRHIVFITAFSVLLLHVFGLASVSKRSEPTTTEKPTETCTGRTPCGWAIYNRTTRFIDYFMKNRCLCENEKKCLRDDDDISIAAYVYRCKVDEEAKRDNPFYYGLSQIR